MTKRSAAFVGTSTTLIAAALMGGAILLTGLAEGWAAAGTLLVPLIASGSFAIVGTLIVSRFPGHLIGWLLIWFGFSLATNVFIETYGEVDLSLPSQIWAVWGGSVIWPTSVFSILTLLPLLFPDGRLPSARWRWVAIMAVSGIAVLVLINAIDPAVLEQSGMHNPVGIEALRHVASPVFLVGILAIAVAFVASLTGLVRRFRGSWGDQRQQIKWFLAGIAMVALGAIALIVLDGAGSEIAGRVAFVASAIALPTTIGIAVLRHRLYEIDVVINRALVYSALTATSLGTYVLIVFVLSRALDPVTRDSDIAVAVSTLAVAALFRPLRARLQAFIDRRFYRRKYDAAEALSRFSSHLRDEVELDALSHDLLAVVGDTMQPSHASLWLRSQEARG